MRLRIIIGLLLLLGMPTVPAESAALMPGADDNEKIVRWPIESSLIGLRLQRRLKGIEIVDLSEDGAYFKMGLRAGDLVIQVNDEKTYQPMHVFRVMALRNGDRLQVNRKGKKILLVFSEKLTRDSNGAPLAGSLNMLTMPFQFGDTEGLWISTMNLMGPFGRIGLRFGDLLLSINGRPLTSENSIHDLLSVKIGDKIQILRANDLGTFEVKPPSTENRQTEIIKPDHYQHFKKSIDEGNFKKIEITVTPEFEA